MIQEIARNHMHSSYGLEKIGLTSYQRVYWNLSTSQLYEEAIRRNEGIIAEPGPLVIHTGPDTGRSPDHTFIVPEFAHKERPWKGGVVSIPNDEFEKLFAALLVYLKSRDLFVFDGYAGADERYRIRVRVVTELAWHNLFAKNMFIRELNSKALETFVPEFTVINAPGYPLATSKRVKIIVNFQRAIALVTGTLYGGESKNTVFMYMNYYLPHRNVLPMHCSANYGFNQKDVALFFGLSGTGKTTLSIDSSRCLIGDDEHGWSEEGIFTFEGGCFAPALGINSEYTSEIYQAANRFGTILQNVVYNPYNRMIDWNDNSLTCNAGSCFPIDHLTAADTEGLADHPQNIFFLVADTYGVLPPICRLNKAQAVYFFLNGYTAKMSATEKGVTEPIPTFSACFGAPFITLHPVVYANLLLERLKKHEPNLWLVNTGWIGGGVNIGSRILLTHTKQIIRNILEGGLQDKHFILDPYFGFKIPDHINGVPEELLIPQKAWSDTAAYHRQAVRLINMLHDNFDQYRDEVGDEILNGEPSIDDKGIF